MKYTIIALSAIGLFFVTSCHKSGSSRATTSSGSVSGLTSVKVPTSLVVDTVVYAIPINVTWTFSGTNPISANSNVDTDYFGSEHISFSDTNAVSWNYNASYIHPFNYFPMTASASYNTAGRVDTLSYQYAGSLRIKLAFIYSGTHISTIIEGDEITTGNFLWPAYTSTFSYTGENITGIVTVSNATTGTSPMAYTYTLGTTANNFSGSFSTFIALEGIVKSTSDIDYVHDLPIFMNPNVVINESDDFGGNGFTFNYLTDATGRITTQIVDGTDSVVYTY